MLAQTRLALMGITGFHGIHGSIACAGAPGQVTLQPAAWTVRSLPVRCKAVGGLVACPTPVCGAPHLWADADAAASGFAGMDRRGAVDGPVVAGDVRVLGDSGRYAKIASGALNIPGKNTFRACPSCGLGPPRGSSTAISSFRHSWESAAH